MNRIAALSIATLALSVFAVAQDHNHMAMHAQSRYAGPAYTGAPKLNLTASLVNAGGGPGKFSTAKAVTAIAGTKLVNAEIAKLTKQYGKEKVGQWIEVGDFAVADALKIATAAGVKLPGGKMTGKALGGSLVQLGLGKDNVFYVEFMLDKLLTHDIHNKVMDDIDAKFGHAADATYHKISNQAYYDLAHALGMKKVKLADFH